MIIRNRKKGHLFRKIVFMGYQILSRNPFSKRYIADMKRMYEIIKPTDEDTIIFSVMGLVMRGSIVSLLVLLFCISFRGTTIYNYIIILSLIYILNNQIIHGSLANEERKLLKQLEKYLGDVRHYYHTGGMVEEAIYDSIEDSDYEISLHMNRIYEILVLDETEEIEKYKEVAPNKFLTTFLALCRVTILYGDTIKDDKSLFLSNLNHLKNEVNIEILKREKLNHAFSGLIFMTIFPVFFLKAIENWSISNLPELEKYYYGKYGIIVSVLIFLFTLVSYSLVNRLKENNRVIRRNHTLLEHICKKNCVKKYLNQWIFTKGSKAFRLDKLLKKMSEGITLRQFLVQKWLLFFFSFLITLLILLNIVAVSKWNAIHYTKDFTGASLVNGTLEIENYRRILEEVSDLYKYEREEETLLSLIHKKLRNHYQLTNKMTKNILTEEIFQRIKNYKRYNYRWYYFIIAFLIALCICNLPLFILECKRIFMRMNMEDEVIQFQSIIIMLMYIQRMNIETILEWLENFSEIFRSSIIECVDNFSYDNEKAFRILKDKEPFLPFVRIIENLEACDRVGIEKAFDEIASQRSFFADKRKQDNEINITNKSVIGRVISYVPLALTLALYLIVPFILESVSQLMGYISQIQGL